MHIIGTAGHVDHGKSSLVKALTGVDPDRLPEEKRRALTIELGFASYRDKEGRTIGVIDVPGHERFIRNMVAGTWALDCALLVIAADDGWMRQTEDHAHVLKGMGVPSVIMVITKSDLATEERLKAVAADARQRSLALFGYGIDTIFTSATRGEGIEELKELIDHHLARITPRHMPPCLQVDRSFIMSGTGPVVTGSLRGTTLSVGDEVTILPSCMKARVRSLQTFGDLVESASDGTRTAVGLQGVSSKDLHKGDCLTRHPAWFAVGTQAMLLLEAPYADGEMGIRNHAQLEAASGTWHDSCAIHLLDRTTRTPRLAKIVCPHAKTWYWRQPVMLMHPGSSSVAALGSVISTRLLDKQEVQQLRELVGQHRGIPENVSGEDHLMLLLNGFGMLANEGKQQLCICGKSYLRISRWHVAPEVAQEIERNVLASVDQSQPLPLEVAKQDQRFPASLVAEVIDRLVQDHVLLIRNGIVERKRSHVPELSGQEQEMLKRIELAGCSGYETKRLAKEDKPVIGTLLQRQHIVILDGMFIYTQKTFANMIGLVTRGRHAGQLMTIAEAKEHLPLSRKYMIPILNQMEREGYLMRVGDARRILKLPEGM